ncbi:fibronectin-like [Coregonus clupeaformis]|uniref:fibronectin-like n=1 Tax=Coregonus clupeaformis TaxID=59861 RepID=UPI001E1C6363|nr:fibronectin-like [Coregonus clupeaformis]
MLASYDDVLPPPGDIQVLLLTSDSVSLSWGSPQGLTGPQSFRVTWGCDGETSSTRVKVVPPRDLKIDHLEETSFTLHWSKAEGMENVPQHFFISNCIPGTDPLAAITDDCHKIFSNLQPGTDITLSDLKPATEYSVTVCTVLEDGKQSQLVLTTLTTVPPAPDQLTVDTTSGTVSWNQPPGLDQTQHHYQISYHCPGTKPNYTTTSSHSLTLSDLQCGTQYSVTVCTVLENGKKSQLVSTTLTKVPPAPAQLNVDSVKTTSAAVSWSQPPGLDQTQHRYQIFYHCQGTQPHYTTTSSHSITLSDLQYGTQYSVTVSTVLENGRQSKPVSTTLTTVLPAPDQLTVDSVDTTSATVSWNQPPGLDQTQHRYQIFYHCQGTQPHYTTTSSHRITLSDLQGGSRYFFNVSTVLENGRQSKLVSTTLTTVHFQWWERPFGVAAVCVLLAVIIGLWVSYATAKRDQLNTRTTERDQLQNILNTRTTERDQLKTRLRYYEKPCLNEWWKFGTSCYYVSSTRDTGGDGQQQCRAMGGELVVINSREEQIFIHRLKKNVWIGATKINGIWEWVDDTAFKPTYWMEGEPSNLNDEVACIEISQTASDPLKSWKVVKCTSNYWVCEKPFTP